MRSLIKFIIGSIAALGSVHVQAQTPTVLPVTGNLNQILGQPSPYAGIILQLQNCPAPVTVPGTGVIVQQTMQVQANASGVVNTQIWPVDAIDCNGTTGQAQYALQYVVNGTPTADPVCYSPTSASGVWNLSTLQPVTCGQTPPNPQDLTINNLDVLGTIQLPPAGLSYLLTGILPGVTSDGANGINVTGKITAGSVQIGGSTPAIPNPGPIGNATPNTGTFTVVNSIQKCETFSGATYDAKVTNCIAALPSGGIADARGFGATTQTVASTIAVGNGKVVTLLTDPATTLVPASTSTTLFNFYRGTRVRGGMTISLPSGYNVAAALISDNIRDFDQFSIEDVSIAGPAATPSVGSSCFAIGDSVNAQVFMRITGTHCNNVDKGWKLVTSGTGFINSNTFAHNFFNGCITAIYTNGGSNSASVAQNVFEGLSTESATWSNAQVVFTGWSYTNFILGWGSQDNAGPYELTFADNSTGNFVEATLYKGYNDTTATPGANTVLSNYPFSPAAGAVFYNHQTSTDFTTPLTQTFITPLRGSCPEMIAGQNCEFQLGSDAGSSINSEFRLNLQSTAAASKIFLGLAGQPEMTVDGLGAVAWGGGQSINTPDNIPHLCGDAGFSSSTTSSPLACSWVTTSSHCSATWRGAVTGGALGYTPAAGSVTLTAQTANSTFATVYCSVN